MVLGIPRKDGSIDDKPEALLAGFPLPYLPEDVSIYVQSSIIPRRNPGGNRPRGLPPRRPSPQSASSGPTSSRPGEASRRDHRPQQLRARPVRRSRSGGRVPGISTNSTTAPSVTGDLKRIVAATMVQKEMWSKVRPHHRPEALSQIAGLPYDGHAREERGQPARGRIDRTPECGDGRRHQSGKRAEMPRPSPKRCARQMCSCVVWRGRHARTPCAGRSGRHAATRTALRGRPETSRSSFGNAISSHLLDRVSASWSHRTVATADIQAGRE